MLRFPFPDASDTVRQSRSMIDRYRAADLLGQKSYSGAFALIDAVLTWLAQQADRWAVFKVLVENTSAVSQDAMHVVGGVLGQLVVACALRSSVARWLPWLAVLGLELINEANDLRNERWPDLSAQIMEGAKDIVLTMLLPTVLLALARQGSQLLSAGAATGGEPANLRSDPQED